MLKFFARAKTAATDATQIVRSALTGSHNWRGPIPGALKGQNDHYVCANCGREMGDPPDAATFHSHCPHWDKPSPFLKKLRR